MKKSLSVILSSAMAFSIFSSIALGADAAKTSADFGDLKNLDAASKAKFDAMISAGIFDGVGEGTFGLKDKMNRAQFAKVAALIFGLPVNTALDVSSFSDVSASDPANGYALPYIEAIKKANLTDGYGFNTYNPAGEVTKEQLAAFLIRGLNKDAAAKSAQGVSDTTVSVWARGYVALAQQLKLMNVGDAGTFDGTSAADRELLLTSAYEAKQQYNVGSINPQDEVSYALTSNIKAQVKGVLQEKTATGWRFGTTTKLTNTSDATVRVPDHELRVKASDGTFYTLKASADNPRAIEPQSTVELNYMTEIDKNKDFNLTDMLWVDVDYEVYPKKETVLTEAPIESIVWHGADGAIQDPAFIKGWGTAFSIPGENSGLSYTATNLSKQFAGQVPTYMVQLKVENKGNYAEIVPAFTLSGKSEAEGRSFVGKRVETSAITVNPGEQKYINFAITTEPETQLSVFYVLSVHNFVRQGANAPLQYYTGRIGLKLPSGGNTESALPPYEMGSRIAIDSLSQAVHPQTEVALLDFDWFENDGQSYKTAVAKLKFTNRSDTPIPVPQLGAEILSNQGVTYNGSESSSSVKDVLPGMGAIRTYAFVVPSSENASQFTFRLLEQQGQAVQAAPLQASQPAQAAQVQQAQVTYKMPIARINVNMKTQNQIGNTYTFYPYEMRMDSHSILYYVTRNAVTSSFNYTYKLTMGIDIKTTDAVLADPSNPKLLFELIGTDGKRLGAKIYPVAGDNRLMSGTQSIMYDSVSDSLETPITVKMYEVVNTPYGDARRLLATLTNQ